MFQKDGASTLGGKKDAPLRKSDRRRLRDRALAVLFTPDDGNDGEAGGRPPPPVWRDRASRLVDDALTTSSADVLSRRLRLAGGELATLFLRTPSKQGGSKAAAPAGRVGERESAAADEIRDSYPTEWPYRSSAQPVLLEYEDGDRETHLVPLLPLLAALPHIFQRVVQGHPVMYQQFALLISSLNSVLLGGAPVRLLARPSGCF